MVKHTRTGMSDAHLRPDLRAQNPLYEMAGSVTAKFEQERCPYHAMSMSEFRKPEHERRLGAIERREKHIVLPPRLWVLQQLRKATSASVPHPVPTLRPSLSMGYASDRVAFQNQQYRLHHSALRAHEQAEVRKPRISAEDMREQFNAPRREALKKPRKRPRTHRR